MLLSAKGIDGAKIVRCVYEGFLKQYVDSPTQKGITLDLVLGNEIDHVASVSVKE